MIEPDKFYKHEYSMDLIIEVLKILRIDRESVYFYARYWNQGCKGRPWLVDESEEPIRIPLSDIRRWHEISLDEMTRPRL
jgi:hypothetical protein